MTSDILRIEKNINEEKDPRKHNLPLTVPKKIPAVRKGDCTQTIRPESSSKPKEVGDLIRLHGWEGRPYRSKWSWRAPTEGYWVIRETFKIEFYEPVDDSSLKATMRIPNRPILPDDEIRERIAKKDWFDGYNEMIEWFLKKYDREEFFGRRYNVIRWSTQVVFP